MLGNMLLGKAKAETTSAERWQQIRQEYRVVLLAIFTSSAAWFFGDLLLLALGLLLVRGRGALILGALPFLVLVLLLAFLTIPLTPHVRQLAPIESHCSRAPGYLLVLLAFKLCWK
jgi:Na+/H+ antiporter NhaB